MARHLVEPAIFMITNHIKANIAAALTDVRDDRNLILGNAGIPTPVPNEYFIAPKYQGYSPPSIFVVCESGDLKKQRGANHINGTMKINVAAIVENQKTDIITRQAWRYQAALSQILDNLDLTSSDNTFRINIIVRDFEFTEEYTDSTKPEDPASKWRKGVRLNCDVEFFEQL